MTPPIINIPELFAAVVQRVNTRLYRDGYSFYTYYDYGRYIEITRRLTQKQMGVVAGATGNNRFPLVWLVIPFDEFNGTPTEHYTRLRNMQIIIATQTRPDSTTPARMNDNFEPILYPIYRALLIEIANSGFFSDIDYGVQHTKTDQPYWGGGNTLTSGDKNLFNDYIDAIQIRNLELTVNLQTCNKFKLIG